MAPIKHRSVRILLKSLNNTLLVLKSVLFEKNIINKLNHVDSLLCIVHSVEIVKNSVKKGSL